MDLLMGIHSLNGLPDTLFLTYCFGGLVHNQDHKVICVLNNMNGIHLMHVSFYSLYYSVLRQ